MQYDRESGVTVFICDIIETFTLCYSLANKSRSAANAPLQRVSICVMFSYCRALCDRTSACQRPLTHSSVSSTSLQPVLTSANHFLFLLL